MATPRNYPHRRKPWPANSAELVREVQQVSQQMVANADAERRRKIREAIAECDRYLDKEGRRAAQPPEVTERLAFYRQHRFDLMAMLEQHVLATPVNLPVGDTGLWTMKDHPAEVRIIGLGLSNCMRVLKDTGGDWGEFGGSPDVLFDTDSWSTKEHGMVYTDEVFLEALRDWFVAHGISAAAAKRISYSEAGMQGAGSISLDVGRMFAEEAVRLFPGNATIKEEVSHG